MHTATFRKLASQHRREIAALKRTVKTLEQRHRVLARTAAKSAAEEKPRPATRLRFSAKGLRSNRDRLGLSAADLGRLFGVTGQTIFNWERGKSTPKPEQLAKLATIRAMGKREVRAALEQVQ